MLRRISAFVIGVALCVPASARASEPGVDVEWSGEGACSSTRFESELRRFLDASTAGVRVKVSVEPAEDGWVLEAEFEGGEGLRGARRFESSTCETVSDAAALAVALAVDPTVLEESEPIEEPKAEARDAPVDEEPSVPEVDVAQAPPQAEAEPLQLREAPEVAPSPAPSRNLWGAFSLRGSIDAGALPAPGAGLSIGATLGVDELRIEVVGGYRFATSTRSTQDPAISAEFTAWTVSARGLWAPSVGPLEVPLGAGIEAGQVSGEGLGLPGLRREARAWVAPEAIAGVHWWFHPHVALLARAVLAVPLYRPSFSIEGLETLHEVGAVQIRGVLGVEARFP